MSTGGPTERFRRRNLPHWEVRGASYFVTFRLHGSLPATVAARWTEERRLLLREWRNLDPEERRSRRRVLNSKFDSQLDGHSQGPTHLKEPSVAELVRDSLEHFGGQRYRLASYVVMPNHVHMVLQPPTSEGWIEPLERVMHSLKSYTAHRANRQLGLEGPFWQREYYDHLLRDEQDIQEFVRYTVENPVKAGLCSTPAEWRWSSARGTGCLVEGIRR